METVGLMDLIATEFLGVRRIIAADTTKSTLYLAASIGASDALNASGNKSLAESLRGHFLGGVDQIMDTTGLFPLIEDGVGS